MFSPEMMAQAQAMMANMKPEDMQRMSQMAANMDPKMMENMMKGMGGGAGMPKIDAEQMKQGAEQMKNMTPEQLKAQMSQAQGQMDAQKKYYFNAAEMLKNEGNSAVKAEKYDEALQKYEKALENLQNHSGADVNTLSMQLMNNSALCYLKSKKYDKAVEVTDKALKIDPRSFKALFRRGQARAELGELQQATADVREASELSPQDKAISAELERLRGILKEKGIKEDTSKPKQHEVSAAWSAGNSTSSGSRATSSSSSKPTSASPGGDAQWQQAAEKIAENPDMLKQATDAMMKMSPDQMEAMMKSTPMPPGMDANMMKQQMEALQKNPDMLKTAMDSLKGMPEEERQKLMAQRTAGMGAGGMPPGGIPPDMGKMFQNPDMIKAAVEMTKSMGDEDLKKMNINSPEEADMMRKAAEQMASNPDLAEQMSNMMKNMKPEDMENMMKMSQAMKGGGQGGPDGMPADPSQMFNDPDMLKATEQMMANMSPEALASMAKASGIDLDEGKAKMVARFLPYLMKLMRLFTYIKKMWSQMWSSQGKVIMAVVVLIIAVLQHYRSS